MQIQQQIKPNTICKTHVTKGLICNDLISGGSYMNRKWYRLLTQPNGVSVTLLCYPERLLWFLARHIWRLNVEKFATIWAANLGINGSCQSGSDRCRRVPPFIRQEGGVPPGRVSVQLFLIGKGAALRPMMLLWLALLPTSCIFDTSSCQLADKQRTVQWEVKRWCYALSHRH